MEDGRWRVAVGDQVFIVSGDATVEALPGSVFSEPKPSKSELHPTMKPVPLVSRHLKNSARPGDIVVDAFGGSGSTAVAAHVAASHAAEPVAEGATAGFVAAAPGAVYDAESAQGAADQEILHDSVDFDPDLAMADDDALPSEAEEGVSPMVARGADAYAAYAAPVTQAEAVVVEDADEAEERFSLRTRSMAEVLAEQGDIKGALDIYHELAAAAVHPEESADLRQRITTLTARLGNVQTSDTVQPVASAEPASGKDKLISMLEALAERVEARAHS